MTLHDVRRLFNHWRRHPPLRALVAASLGVNVGPPEDRPRYMTTEEAIAMQRLTGGRIEGVRGM